MANKQRGRKLVTRVTLQERYLLLIELVKEARILQKAKRIFIDQNSRERLGDFEYLGWLPEMHIGAKPLIGDILDLLHLNGPIITDGQLEWLLRNAESHAAKLEKIYKAIALQVTSWPTSDRRDRVHQRARQVGFAGRIISPDTDRHHYRDPHC